MSSGSEDCLVVETKILSDKKWVETLEKKELEWFNENQIPFEELEDKKVVCTACFKQGNHKQKVILQNCCDFRFILIALVDFLSSENLGGELIVENPH